MENDHVPTRRSTRSPTASIPWLRYIVCKGAGEAIDFYKKAFGAEEQFRLNGPNNTVVHCCLRIGDSPLMLTDECPQMQAFGPGTPGRHARHHPPLGGRCRCRR